MKKIILHFCFPLFLFHCAGLSAFEIPSQLARLEKKIEGSNGKTIFLIQEAHSNDQVQKNIAELLRYLIQFHGLSLVLVEGGWGNLGLNYLRNYASREGRLKVAEDYLKSGKISGEEYLDMTSDLEMQLWGIEDAELYEQNMKAFLAIHPQQKEWLSELSKLKSSLDALAEKIFPKALREFREKQEAFQTQNVPLLEYLRFLAKTQNDAKALKKFPNLQKLMSLAGEDEFDPSKVEWEKQELIRALSRRMTKPELEELALHENRKTSEEELGFIQVLLSAYHREPAVSGRFQAGHLKRYAAALEEGLKIDSQLLFSEIRGLEDRITEPMAQTPDQKQLLAIQKAAAVLEKLFKLELGPEDFANVRENALDFDFKVWKKFLKTHGSPFPGNTESFQTAFRQAQKFYIAAEAREKAMIANALRKMEEEKASQAALISGGFHTEHLSRSFQKLGFTVLILSPRFSVSLENEPHQKRYFQILKENWEPPAADSITNLRLSPIQGDIHNAPRQ